MDTYTRRIPKPMIGMNWQPSPSDYASIPPPSKYGDTDFANDDFAALWGASGRNDLQKIKELGCNTIKMYTIGHPAPNGHWMRNHKGFFNRARELGLSVILPISNYFVGEAYKNRTSPPSNPLDIKSMVFDMVAEVYAEGNPGSAIIWAIGNEYDLIPNGAYGFFEASDIATVASYVIDAESKLQITSDNALAFTSPVSAATVPLNKSIPCFPPFNSLGGGCANNAIIQEFTKRGIQPQRFIASVDIYEVRQQLVNYFEAFPRVLPNVPMFHGELGWSAADGGDGKQAENIASQFSTTVDLAQKGSYFFGACCFEFSDELWKGPPNTSETKYGIYTFSGQLIQTASQGNHSPVWGAQYPVDNLAQRPAVSAFINAVLSSPPEPISTDGKVVTIESVHFGGTFMRLDGRGVGAMSNSGGGKVDCHKGAQGWEQFLLREIDSGIITLESKFFPGVYVRMDGSSVKTSSGSGAGVVNAQFGARDYEKFRLKPMQQGEYAIESVRFPGVVIRMDATGVVPGDAGGGTVNCQLGAGGWEVFRLHYI